MNILKINMEKSAYLALKCLENNHMKANPSKFQVILYIDDNLSFNENVSKLCVKAARQTNALSRIVKYIPNECR